MRIRKLIREVTIHESNYILPSVYVATEEVIQVWDGEQGWMDLPVDYEFITVKKD